MQKRSYIIYSGSVQGVGFRFTAQRIADSLGLTGWIRNLPDGSVEAVCEGEEKDIALFIAKIRNELGPYIRSANVKWEKASGEYQLFDIKYYNQ